MTMFRQIENWPKVNPKVNPYDQSLRSTPQVDWNFHEFQIQIVFFVDKSSKGEGASINWWA